jgi:hypothetical protein
VETDSKSTALTEIKSILRSYKSSPAIITSLQLAPYPNNKEWYYLVVSTFKEAVHVFEFGEKESSFSMMSGMLKGRDSILRLDPSNSECQKRALLCANKIFVFVQKNPYILAADFNGSNFQNTKITKSDSI